MNLPFERNPQLAHVRHAEVDELLESFLADVLDDALLKDELAVLVRDEAVLREDVVVLWQSFKLQFYQFSYSLIE